MGDPTPSGDSGVRARFSPRAILAIGATLAAGAVASLLGFRTVRAWEVERARSAFELEAKDQVASIRREIEAVLGEVHSLAALYDSSHLVERGEFRSFVARGLERRNSPLQLVWIERVPGSQRTDFERAARDEGLTGFVFHERSRDGTRISAGERDEYWVNWYLEPQEHDTTALGFDQASEPDRHAALQESRDANAPVLIGPLQLAASSSSPPVLLAVIPIFDPPAAASDASLRRKALHGFVGAAFPAAETIETALRGKRENALVVRVSDASLSLDERLLYPAGATIQTAAPREEDFVHVADVQLENRRWTVICSRDAGSAAAAVTGLSWGLLGAGLVVTMLLGLTVASATGRARLKRLVDARTTQWKRRNRALAEEIDERARAEKDLRANRQRTELILDSALDAVVTMDEKGLVTGWNPTAEEVFGWAKSDVLARPMVEVIVPHEHREAHRRGVERYLATGEGPLMNRRIEISALRRDGSQFPVELSIAPFQHGGKTTFSAFIRDITDRKNAERQQTELMRELERQLKSYK